MSNIVQAKITVKGVRPILWHHFGPDAIPLEKKEKSGVAGNDPEEWKKTVLMTGDRQLYIDPSYVFGCVREASKYTKKGRGTLMNPVSATLQVVDNRILVDRFVPEEPIPTDLEKPVYMDIRSVKNPTTKGRNVRYRIAASAGWSASFSLQWDKTIVSRNEMQSVLNDAGQLVGLGNGRTIGFGRFVVESFELQE